MSQLIYMLEQGYIVLLGIRYFSVKV